MRISLLTLVAWLVFAGQAHADLSAKEQQAIVPLYLRSGHNVGTGFWAGGYLHTAGHVVACGALYIYDGGYKPVTVHYSDDDTYDYARCSVAGYKPKVSLRWASDLCDGQRITLYGYRLNKAQQWSGIVDDTVYPYLTGVMRNEVLGRAALGTCKSKNGNSGGAVVNRDTNEVVGVLTHANPWGKAVFLRSDMVPR